MRLLICGSREWSDYQAILTPLSADRDLIECVIEGEAAGADTYARIAAQKLKIPVQPFPANWDKYGKAAGSIRNKQMLTEGRPNEIWAFTDHLQGGTLDMIRQALATALPVVWFSHDGEEISVLVFPDLQSLEAFLRE